MDERAYPVATLHTPQGHTRHSTLHTPPWGTPLWTHPYKVLIMGVGHGFPRAPVCPLNSRGRQFPSLHSSERTHQHSPSFSPSARKVLFCCLQGSSPCLDSEHHKTFRPQMSLLRPRSQCFRDLKHLLAQAFY